MDRFQTSDSDRLAAMRAGRFSAIELLLRSDLRERTEPVAAAFARRAVHALPFLWQPPHAGGTEARRRVRHQPQTHSTVDGCSRTGGDLSEAASEPASSGPRDPSLSAARPRDQLRQPGLEQRYYLCSAARWVRLPRCCHRLVQSFRPELGGFQHSRCKTVPRVLDAANIV